MATFLLIPLTVVLVIGGLITVLVLWLRKRFNDAAGDYSLIGPYLLRQSARIKLRQQPVAEDHFAGEPEGTLAVAEMHALWEQLAAEGMNLVGTFTSDADQRLLIAGQHPDNNIVGVVTYVPGTAPYVEFMTLSAANTVRMLSGEPGVRALRLESLMIEHKANPTYRYALAAMIASGGRSLSASVLAQLIERVHAARTDCQLARAPGLEEMRSHAAARGVKTDLSDQQQEQALEMNRSAWIREVRVALLDNARRKLKLDEASWALLENDLIVIHKQLQVEDIAASLAEHDLTDTLASLQVQQYTDAARIFDEINQRLDPLDQRELVSLLDSPVEARLFARKGVLTNRDGESRPWAA